MTKLDLKAYFALKRLSQKVVADQLGIKSRVSIHRYVNGHRKFPEIYHEKLCEIIGIDLEEFKMGNIVERINSKLEIVEEIKKSFQNSMDQIEAKDWMSKEDALFLLRESFLGILDRAIIHLRLEKGAENDI